MPLTLTATEGVFPKGTEKQVFQKLCEAMLNRGVLTRETHGATIRLAPPLVATESDIEHLVGAVAGAITDVVPAGRPPGAC